MDALADLAVETDHVLAHAGGAEPDRARHGLALLQPAVAAPPDPQPALQHDDDLGVANLDLAEVAFGVAPAFRQ